MVVQKMKLKQKTEGVKQKNNKRKQKELSMTKELLNEQGDSSAKIEAENRKYETENNERQKKELSMTKEQWWKAKLKQKTGSAN